jgi:hypothetical protein
MDYQHAFHGAVYTGKIMLTLLLLILSLINGHKEFVEKNPRGFIAGCVIFAVLTGLASGFVAFNRNGDWMSAMFITVIFFFFFAVCREFSGYYAIMEGETHTSQLMDKEVKILKIIGGLGVLAALVGGGFLAYKAGVKPPVNPRFVNFWIELLIFVTLATLGEVGLAVQHGDKSYSGAGLTAIIFLISHIYLQYGGFYDDVFSPLNWNAVSKIN